MCKTNRKNNKQGGIGQVERAIRKGTATIKVIPFDGCLRLLINGAVILSDQGEDFVCYTTALKHAERVVNNPEGFHLGD